PHLHERESGSERVRRIVEDVRIHHERFEHNAPEQDRHDPQVAADDEQRHALTVDRFHRITSYRPGYQRTPTRNRVPETPIASACATRLPSAYRSRSPAVRSSVASSANDRDRKY